MGLESGPRLSRCWLIAANQEVNSIDNDVRSKYNQYNSIRTTLQTLVRKQTGNLSTKSLLSIVSPDLLVKDSEHLETHLVAVPNSGVKDFLRSYETVAPMVVPRSAQFVASDDEYTLYAVTLFRKHAQEFVHKARERKWVPRDYKYKQGGKEEEEKELKRVEAEEKRVWGETLRLGRTGWSEGVMCLVHVIVLRVFVETVLRYGLPLDFVSVLIKVCTPTLRCERLASHEFCVFLVLTCGLRPIISVRRKSGKPLMQNMPTWRATRSAGTAKAG